MATLADIQPSLSGAVQWNPTPPPAAPDPAQAAPQHQAVVHWGDTPGGAATPDLAAQTMAQLQRSSAMDQADAAREQHDPVIQRSVANQQRQQAINAATPPVSDQQMQAVQQRSDAAQAHAQQTLNSLDNTGTNQPMPGVIHWGDNTTLVKNQQTGQYYEPATANPTAAPNLSAVDQVGKLQDELKETVTNSPGYVTGAAREASGKFGRFMGSEFGGIKNPIEWINDKFSGEKPMGMGGTGLTPSEAQALEERQHQAQVSDTTVAGGRAQMERNPLTLPGAQTAAGFAKDVVPYIAGSLAGGPAGTGAAGAMQTSNDALDQLIQWQKDHGIDPYSAQGIQQRDDVVKLAGVPGFVGAAAFEGLPGVGKALGKTIADAGVNPIASKLIGSGINAAAGAAVGGSIQEAGSIVANKMATGQPLTARDLAQVPSNALNNMVVALLFHGAHEGIPAIRDIRAELARRDSIQAPSGQPAATPQAAIAEPSKAEVGSEPLKSPAIAPQAEAKPQVSVENKPDQVQVAWDQRKAEVQPHPVSEEAKARLQQELQSRRAQPVSEASTEALKAELESRRAQPVSEASTESLKAELAQRNAGAVAARGDASTVHQTSVAPTEVPKITWNKQGESDASSLSQNSGSSQGQGNAVGGQQDRSQQNLQRSVEEAKPAPAQVEQPAGELKPGGKEPWQMTQRKYQLENNLEKIDDGKEYDRESARLNQQHLASVKQALQERKPIPAEVLKDYPNLKPSEGTAGQGRPTVEAKESTPTAEQEAAANRSLASQQAARTPAAPKAPTMEDTAFVPPAQENKAQENKADTTPRNLIGEPHLEPLTGSKTKSMFGDISQGPASGLEAETQRQAAEARSQVDKDQGKLPLGNELRGGKLPTLNTTDPTARRQIAQAAKQILPAIPATKAISESPATLDQIARGVIGKNQAEAIQKLGAVDKGFAAARQIFNRLSKSDVNAFMDAAERGKTGPTPELDQIAKTMQHLYTTKADEINQNSRGEKLKPEDRIANYMGRSYKDPNIATGIISQILGKKLMGAKGFLKERTFQFDSDVRAARADYQAKADAAKKAGNIAEMQGNQKKADALTPAHENPVDQFMAKYSEMEKYNTGLKIYNEFADRGLSKFVKSLKDVPEGNKVPLGPNGPDTAYTVYGPRSIAVPEAVNAELWQGGVNFLNSLGVDVERKMALGKGALGLAKGDTVSTKFGTPADILFHEAGHIIDDRYAIRDSLMQDTQGRVELAKLANERMNGLNLSATTKNSFSEYLHSPAEQVANAVHALVIAPEKLAKIAPLTNTRLREFLNQTPELKPLLDIKPGVSMGMGEGHVAMPGTTIMGYRTLPNPVANVMENYLSEGLQAKLQKGGTAGRVAALADTGLQKVTGAAMTVKLGASLFHGTTTSFMSGVSDLGSMIQNAGLGKWKEAGIAGLRTVLTPLNIARRVAMAEHMRSLVNTDEGKLSPENAAYVREWTKGGATFETQSLMHAGELQAIQSAFNKLRRPDGTPWEMTKGVGNLGFHSVAGVMRATTSAVLRYAMDLKVGTELDRMTEARAQMGPNAHPDSIVQQYREISNQMDAMFGQVRWQNQFFPRLWKDVAQRVFFAPGWTGGNIAAFVGGAKDLATIYARTQRGEPWITHRMATIPATLLYMAGAGAIYQYYKTGTLPQKPDEYFAPKDGGKDENGNDTHVQFPSMLKDWHGYATHPIQTTLNKTSPFLNYIGQVASDKDYWGNDITTPVRGESTPDKLRRIAGDELSYFLKQWTPLSASNFMRAKQEGQTTQSALSTLVGISPTPKRFNQGPGMNALDDARDAGTHFKLTTEQQAKHQEITDTVSAIRQGQPGATDAADQKYPPASKEMKEIKARLNLGEQGYRLSKTPAKDLMDTFWPAADDKEKVQAAAIINQRVQSAHLPPDIKKAHLDTIHAWYNTLSPADQAKANAAVKKLQPEDEGAE